VQRPRIEPHNFGIAKHLGNDVQVVSSKGRNSSLSVSAMVDKVSPGRVVGRSVLSLFELQIL
ncbi:MAG: hypothetical protein V3U59_02070, partial [Gammaproteobacteria bacterium]